MLIFLGDHLTAMWRGEIIQSSATCGEIKSKYARHRGLYFKKLSFRYLGHYIGWYSNLYVVDLNRDFGVIWGSALISVALGLFHGQEPYSAWCLGSCRVGRFLHVNKTDRQTLDSLTLAVQVGDFPFYKCAVCRCARTGTTTHTSHIFNKCHKLVNCSVFNILPEEIVQS